MLVGDLIYNNDFYINTNVAVFDCSGTDASWHEKGSCVRFKKRRVV